MSNTPGKCFVELALCIFRGHFAKINTAAHLEPWTASLEGESALFVGCLMSFRVKRRTSNRLADRQRLSGRWRLQTYTIAIRDHCWTNRRRYSVAGTVYENEHDAICSKLQAEQRAIATRRARFDVNLNCHSKAWVIRRTIVEFISREFLIHFGCCMRVATTDNACWTSLTPETNSIRFRRRRNGEFNCWNEIRAN